jgi:hypothetical protein
MKKIMQWLLICLLSGLAFCATAQQKKSTGPWSFHSINNIGLLEGQTGSSFQIQTVNGAQYKSWFGGIGLGLDYYRYRTIPLFLDIRKEFGKSSNKLFLYADMGVSFCWLTDNQKMNYYQDDHFNNGMYGDFGVGYKIGLGRNDHDHLLLSLGYTFKKLNETYDAPEYFYPPAPGPVSKDQINYNLNRLSIKIGWEF